MVAILTEHGSMKPERLYESLFTDLNPRGPEGVFDNARVDRQMSLPDDIRMRAVA